MDLLPVAQSLIPWLSSLRRRPGILLSLNTYHSSMHECVHVYVNAFVHACSVLTLFPSKRQKPRVTGLPAFGFPN